MMAKVLDRQQLPFLKWVGGKRWLVDEFGHLIPTNFNKYVEPFLGSGAFFFHLRPKSAILSDTNQDLIAAYEGLKSDWEKVLSLLRSHQENHSKKYYYLVRNQHPRSVHSKAARLIYLNRTCWNGVYRVNRLGTFNVPIGTKRNVILDTDDFEGISRILANASLCVSDFAAVIGRARKGDLIYADPPYTVNHDRNGFLNYNEKLFTWADQERLCNALVKARDRGAHIIASNAHHPSIKGLYGEHFKLLTVSRRNTIAGDKAARGMCREYLIIG